MFKLADEHEQTLWNVFMSTLVSDNIQSLVL